MAKQLEYKVVSLAGTTPEEITDSLNAAVLDDGGKWRVVTVLVAGPYQAILER